MSALAVAQPTTLATTSVADRYVPGTALTAEQAAVLTAEIGATLIRAQDMLRVAFQGRAHEALGFGAGQAGWVAYFAAHFADIVVALPVAQRQLEVAKWNEVGGSVRVTATALGASVGTISADRKVVGSPDNVVSLDGRRRDAATASATAVAAKVKPAKPLTLRAEELFLAAGRDGLTSAEIGARLRVHHGRYSATVTRLEQQRRIVRTADKRNNHSVYVAAAILRDIEDIVDAEIIG